MVGKEVGKDMGGILNRGSPFCPEDSTQDWEYWVDWMEVKSATHKSLVSTSQSKTKSLYSPPTVT